MKPLIVIKPGSISDRDIKELRDNGFVVVKHKNPAEFEFVQTTVNRTPEEDAAIQLSRKLMTQGYWQTDVTRQQICSTFVDILVRGSKLDPRPSKQETEAAIFSQAKTDEIRKLAREEAKAEREARKKQP